MSPRGDWGSVLDVEGPSVEEKEQERHSMPLVTKFSCVIWRCGCWWLPRRGHQEMEASGGSSVPWSRRDPSSLDCPAHAQRPPRQLCRAPVRRGHVGAAAQWRSRGPEGCAGPSQGVPAPWCPLLTSVSALPAKAAARVFGEGARSLQFQTLPCHREANFSHLLCSEHGP